LIEEGDPRLRGGASTVVALLVLRADHTAHAAVVFIEARVDALVVAAGETVRTPTLPIHAHVERALSAAVSARTAVARVSVGRDALIPTERLSKWALAPPQRADAPHRARHATGTTILLVRLNVDTHPVANRASCGAVADASDALLTRSARSSACPAARGAGLQIGAAVGGAARG
jgi:hypothetical protein